MSRDFSITLYMQYESPAYIADLIAVRLGRGTTILLCNYSISIFARGFKGIYSKWLDITRWQPPTPYNITHPMKSRDNLFQHETLSLSYPL